MTADILRQTYWHELSFNSLCNNQFHSLFDISSKQHKDSDKLSVQLTKSMTEKLQSAESEMARIQS